MPWAFPMWRPSPATILTDKLTPRQFSEMMGLSYEEACILYAAYAADQEDNYGPIVGGIDSYTVSADGYDPLYLSRRRKRAM